MIKRRNFRTFFKYFTAVSANHFACVTGYTAFCCYSACCCAASRVVFTKFRIFRIVHIVNTYIGNKAVACCAETCRVITCIIVKTEGPIEFLMFHRVFFTVHSVVEVKVGGTAVCIVFSVVNKILQAENFFLHRKCSLSITVVIYSGGIDMNFAALYFAGVFIGEISLVLISGFYIDIKTCGKCSFLYIGHRAFKFGSVNSNDC